MTTETSQDAASSDNTIIIPDWALEAEAQIRRLVQGHNDTNQPLMVAVVGIPGSGKTTISNALRQHLDDLGCLVFPHDGYHYSLAELRQLENAPDYIYRRGAPDTFNARALHRDLDRIRHGSEARISLPGFEHAIGDPIPDTHVFQRDCHRVIICEGLYLLHDRDGWQGMAQHFDYTVFLDANVDQCMERLKIRNQCIPGYTPEEIIARVDAVDRRNALTVDQCRPRAQAVVKCAF